MLFICLAGAFHLMWPANGDQQVYHSRVQCPTRLRVHQCKLKHSASFAIDEASLRFHDFHFCNSALEVQFSAMMNRLTELLLREGVIAEVSEYGSDCHVVHSLGYPEFLKLQHKSGFDAFHLSMLLQ